MLKKTKNKYFLVRKKIGCDCNGGATVWTKKNPAEYSFWDHILDEFEGNPDELSDAEKHLF